jgi:hypothetical protein
MPKTFAAAAILALSLVACGGGDDDEGADGGSEADASLADYSEANCDELFLVPQVPDEVCCYSGGAMTGCDQVIDLDGDLGCIDQIVDGVPMCAFFACETMVDDLAECE